MASPTPLVCLPTSATREAVAKYREIGCSSDDRFVAEAVDLVAFKIDEKLAADPFSIFVIGLSGGSTPGPVYDSLSRVLRRGLIDGNRLFVFLVDERYVPSDSQHSNSNLIGRTLLKDGLIPKENLVFPNTSLPISDCVSKYNKDMAWLLRSGSPDLVILGMGDDGHIASWFPYLSQSEYSSATDKSTLVYHTTQNRFDVTDRITVSLSLIAAAECKIFLLSGDKKVSKWLEMLDCPDKDSRKFPAWHVIESGEVTVVSQPPLRLADDEQQWKSTHLTIVVLGASGDLAKKKTFSAIFNLHCEGHLPDNFHVVGFARTKMNFEEFWVGIEAILKKHGEFHSNRKGCCSRFRDTACFVESFKRRCSYKSGNYDSAESFDALNEHITSFESPSKGGNRLLYLALPPSVFYDGLKSFKASCWSPNGWTRVVIEKPFGRDLQSSEELSVQLMSLISEAEAFRIDHYLGKEMVLSLMTLRFANVAFMPLFHRHYVKCVRLTFKEDIGTQGRGGYFDQYGIIRDVMQNHLMQLLAMVAMERPALLQDEDVRDEKVKVLKQIPPIRLEDVVLGQYTASKDGKTPGYLDDPTVPRESMCPTFCTAILWVNSERWYGVPFIMKAGKALEKRVTEIRIQLHPIPGRLFNCSVPENELVITVQPNEAVYLKMVTKKPGLSTQLEQTELDLSVMDRFDLDRLPDAYERLILDVVTGNKQNFVRTDELREAWRVFSPMLLEIEEKQVRPLPYEFGSHGPERAYSKIQEYYSYHQDASYSWTPKAKSSKPPTD